MCTLKLTTASIWERVLDTNNRICNFCEKSLNLIGDEMHFIL